MQPGSRVLLNDEAEVVCWLDVGLATGFSSFGEVALGAIDGEAAGCHRITSPDCPA